MVGVGMIRSSDGIWREVGKLSRGVCRENKQSEELE
jgi:hypothetical protein